MTEIEGVGKLIAAVVAVTAMALAPQAVAAPSFGAPVNFDTGASPASVALGDFDGDSKADVVTANSGSTDGTDGVSVLLNTTPSVTSPPNLGAPTHFRAGPNPAEVTVGDLNGDLRPDIAVANGGSGSGSNGVSVLLNTAGTSGSVGASFSGPFHFDAGASPASVAIADLNLDDRADLAIANSGSATGVNGVSVLLSSTAVAASAPTFAAPVGVTVGANPASVAVGQLASNFNDDTPDVVTANSGSATGAAGVSVVRNTTIAGTSTPSFDAPISLASGPAPSAVSVRNVNNDGLLDIATANTGSATGVDGLTVLLNANSAPGDGTLDFGSPFDFDTGPAPRSVTRAYHFDFVNFREALLTANSGSVAGTNGVSGLVNTTTTGAATPVLSSPFNLDAGAAPTSAVSGDLTGDGPNSLVTANSGSANGVEGVSVLPSTVPADGEISPRCGPGGSPPTTSSTISWTRGASNAPVDLPNIDVYSTRVVAPRSGRPARLRPDDRECTEQPGGRSPL